MHAVVVADPDHRLGVALVGDLIERDIAEEPGGFGGVGLEPLPVIIVVDVLAAVRHRPAEHHVVQSAEADSPVAEAELGGGLGEPLAVTVPGRGVEPERVVLRRQDSQVLERAALLGDDGIESCPERRSGYRSPPVPRAIRVGAKVTPQSPQSPQHQG